MNLELSSDEAELLKTQLHMRIEEMDGELVHTDKHELQVALDREIERLRVIDERLGRLIARSGD